MSAPIGHPIPPPTSPAANQKIAGTVYELSVSLPSKAGRVGPFELPSGASPPKKAFAVWVEYYVNAIGAYIELLNALQFKVQANPAVVVQEFADTFSELAGLLDIGPGNSVPGKLIWPLNNIYSCSPDEPLSSGDFISFTVTVDAIDAANKYSVVNCTILIHATWQIAPESNSSSYLATGSSSA